MKKTAWWMWVLRIGLFLVAAVISLAALAAAWISFDGRKELAKTKSELLARGEKLSLAELLPPPIPDEQNFFADPMWLELADLVEASNGSKEPRLPRGERQLDALNRDFTAEDEAAFKGNFPSIQGEQKSAASAVVSLLRNWDLLSPEDRKKRAEYLQELLEFDQSLMGRIHDLLQRPSARFLLNFEDGYVGGNIHYTDYILRVAQRLRAHALIDLELGNMDQAARNTQALFSLSEKLQQPLLIQYLVRISLVEMGLSLVDLGLKRAAWSEADLLKWENNLWSWNEFQQLQRALRGERGGFNAFAEDIYTGQVASLPLAQLWASPWMRMLLPGEHARSNQVYQHWIDALENANQSGSHSAKFAEMEAQKTIGSHSWRYPLTWQTAPLFDGIFSRALVTQIQINQTRIACALERYRLAHGEYPGSLEGLAPGFLPEIPSDVVTAQPMRYERPAPDSFRLWSVGSNEIDEGGVPGKTRDTGDWVWGTPIPRK